MVSAASAAVMRQGIVGTARGLFSRLMLFAACAVPDNRNVKACGLVFRW